MKKKIYSILVLIIMLLNNSALIPIVNAIEETEVKPETIAENNLVKYVNYDKNANKGLVLELNVKTGVNFADLEKNSIERSLIEMQLPEIEGVYPEKVTVVARNTESTNGKNSSIEEKYDYNSENGKLNIETSNDKDQNGNMFIPNSNDLRDDYEVICIYNEKAYTKDEIERELNVSVNVKQQVSNVGEISKNENYNYKVSNNVGQLTTISVETEDIYNGYIRSNVDNNTEYETKYNEKQEVTISNINVANKIEILEKDNIDDIKISKTILDKNQVIKLLGEEGKLEILSSSKETLYEINKDTQDNNGKIEISYSEPQQELIFKTSNLKQEGILNIQNEKVIQKTYKDIKNKEIISNNVITEIAQEKQQVEVVENETTVIKEELVDKEISNNEYENKVEIKDTATKVDFNTNKKYLTNSTQNDVTFTIDLLANDSSCSLFKNPTLKIELPSEVDKLIIQNTVMLYNNGLEIKNISSDDKTITIELQGEQKQYLINDVSKGAEIKISATVILSKTMQSKNSEVKLSVTNEKDKSITEKSIGTTLFAKDTIKKAEDAIYTQAVNDTVDGIKIDVATLLGNKAVTEEESVKNNSKLRILVTLTNTTTSSIENIDVTGFKPENAAIMKGGDTDPVDNRDNYYDDKYVVDEGKTESNFENITIAAGQTTKVYYEIMVTQANVTIDNKVILKHNDIQIGEYHAYNKTIDGEFDIKAKVDYEVAKGKNAFIYLVDIKNITDHKLENINISFELLNGLNFTSMMYTNNKEIVATENNNVVTATIENLDVYIPGNSGGVTRIAIRATANILEEGSKSADIPFVLSATADNVSENYSNLIIEKVLVPVVTITKESDKEGQIVKAGEIVNYTIVAKNLTTGDGTGGILDDYSTRIFIKDNLPDELIGLEASYEVVQYNDTTKTYEKKTVTKDLTQKTIIGESTEEYCDINYDTMILEGDTITVHVKAQVADVYELVEVGNYATATGSEINAQVSNTVKITAAPKNYQEQPTDPEDPSDPETPVDPTVPTNPDNPDDTYPDDQDPTKPTDPSNPDDEMTPDDPSNPTDPNNPTDPTDPSNPSDPSNPDESKYSISGIAWIDENKDGRRNSEEEKLSNINVKIFDTVNNKLLTDASGNTLKVVTNEKGEYTFQNIVKGKYVVIFEYNKDKYTVTEYQKNGVPSLENSDVISKELELSGESKEVAVSDVIELAQNTSNIDMGLVQKSMFDFKIQKYVSKITIKNNSGTKKYSYENTKMAKVEIPSKYISNSTIVVEYKISITNEGDVAGYANEIFDYAPSELSFNSELNKSWYIRADGTLGNTSLLNTSINPGETKDVSLVMTYKSSSTSGGTITNSAEIGKSSNGEGLVDNDSTSGNKVKGEDDMSEAQILLSVGTGIDYDQLMLIVTIIGILSIIAFFGIKKIKINKKISIFVSFIVIIFGFTVVQSNAAFITWEDLHWAIHGGDWDVSSAWEGGDDAFDGYWCISPGYALCSGGHEFDEDGSDEFYTKSDAESALGAYHSDWNLPDSETDNDVPDINATLSGSGDDITYTTSKTTFGPYTLSMTDKGEYDSEDITLEAYSNGTNITSEVDFVGISDVNDLNDGSEFYVVVPNDINSVNIEINFTAQKEIEFNYIDVTYYEGEPNDDTCTCARDEDGEVENSLQTLIEITPETYQETITKTATVTITKKLKDGFKVTKYGESGTLNNVGFNVKSSEFGWISGINPTEYSSSQGSAYEFRTSGGVITCDNLIPGNYEFYEVYNQNYGYKANVDKYENKLDLESVATSRVTGTIDNDQQLGNIVVQKKSNEYPSTNIQKNVKYIIAIKEGSSGTEKYLQYQGGAYKTSKSSATIFTGDANGRLDVEEEQGIGLEVYYDKDKKYVYVVYEVENPNIGYKGCLDGSTQCKSENLELEDEGTENTTMYNSVKLKDLNILKKGSNNETQANVKFKLKATEESGQSYYVVIDGKSEIAGDTSSYQTEEYPNITYSSSYGTLFVTDNVGKIYIEYLEIYSELNGKYTYQLEEVYNPNYGYKGSINVGRGDSTSDIEADESLNVSNIQQLADLTILKKGSNNEILSGVTFRIKCDGKYIQFVNSSGTAMTGTNNIVGNASQSMTYNINRISGADVSGSFTGKIKYVDSVSDATMFRTDVNGKINITGLEVYKNNSDARFLYQIDELRNYNYGYKGTINQNRDNISYGYLTSDQLLTLQVGNTQQLGDIYIKKVDSRAAQIPLPNIGFKIQITDGTTTNYIRINNANRITGLATVNLSGSNLNTSATDSNATVFLTDTNGELTIKNLERFYDIDAKYKYTLIEVENPYFGYWLNSSYVQWSVTSGTLVSQSNSSQNKVTATITLEDASGTTTSVSRVLNKNIQKYTQISGYVWIDFGQNTKSIHFDSVYDPSVAQDKLANGIKVTLYKNGTALKSEFTDTNGAYKFGDYIAGNDNRVTVDGYTIDSLLLVDLSQYWIEFEYNGVKYESVQVQLLLANGSKAKEKDSDRTIVNQKYSTISGTTYKNDATGESTGISSTGNNTLNYDRPTDNQADVTNYYSSKIQYCYGNSAINDYYGLDQYHIKADTATAGGSPFTYTPTNLQQLIDGIININLGMVEREQPDLAIAQDIDKVKLELNGNQYTYAYALRNDQTVTGTGTAPNVNYSNTRYNVDFRYQNQYTNKYTRTLYPNDIEYGKNPGDSGYSTNSSKYMKMTVTYKVNVINQSNTLDTTVNKIVEYYDAKYSKEPTAYMPDGTPLTVTTAVGNAQYKKVAISGSALQQKISANSVLTLYLQYEIDKPNLMSMLSITDDELAAGKSTELNCVVEIASFTSYYKASNTLYAGIDLDSAPENATIGTETTYEDDTDKAPTFAIVVSDHERILNGFVWEDEKETDLTSVLGRTIEAKERLGNGYKDDPEKDIIYNAKVELCYAEGCQSEGAVKDEVATLSDGVTKAVLYTDDKGWYQFDGVVPDKYYIKYTYDGYTYILDKNKTYTINKNSHSDVTVSENGTTVKPIDIRDYKSTIITSNAIKNALQNGDKDWFLRSNVEKYSNAIDSLASRTAQNDVYYGVVKNDPSQSIEASTALMRVNIEYTIEEETKVTSTEGTGYTLTEGVRVYTHEKSNMDFGIIERPHVEFGVEKVVDNIKITLSNGQVLLDGNPYTDNLNYIKQMPGYIYAEIDNELIQGATLEIRYRLTVTNKCEIDYKETGAVGYVPSQPYYFYGTLAGEKTQARISKFADYLTGDLKYIGGLQNDKNTALDWTVADIAGELHNTTSGAASYRISDKVYETLMGITNEDKKYQAFYTNYFENLQFDEVRSAYMVTSKVLSNKDEIYLDNHAEIMELSGGRKVKDCIPGNHDPLDSTTFETDDSYTDVAIVPPTGINVTTFIYIGIGVISLITLAGGIIFIKKKVIK